MSNVLIVLSSYYPMTSANGNCAKRIAEELRIRGNNVFCLCHKQTTNDAFEIDGIKVFCIDNYPQTSMAIKSKEKGGYVQRRIYDIAAHGLAYLRTLETIRSFPLTKWMVNKYIVMIDEICKNNNVDVIIAINKPIDAVYAAIEYKNTHPEVKVISYLLDPIAGGYINPLLSKGQTVEKCTEIEHIIVEKSDVIIALEEHKHHYDKEKIGIHKINYLGVPLLQNKTSNHKKSEDEFIVVYAGFVDTKIRDPRFIVNTFKYVKEAKLRMYITEGSDYIKEIIKENDRVEVYERISNKELNEVYAKADAFLNIGNSSTDQSPSKLIDYISYGKRIISTYRIDSDTSEAILAQYPLQLCLDERKNKYEEAAKLIDQFLEKSLSNTPYPDILDNYKKYTPAAFVECCNGLLR